MKSALRKKLSARRSQLSASYRRSSSDEIIKRISQQLLDKGIKSLALYHPINNEVDILALADFCSEHSVTMALPVAAGFAVWDVADELQLNQYGIKQPLPDKPLIIPQVIITPLLGFDRRGNRIGYGAGFYDKMLSAMPLAVKIGVAYSTQEESVVPRENHDIKLDAVVTELEIIKSI